MKILLIGEYSRFHNSLKEGLQTLGHQVTLVGTGDAFKKFPVDINIAPIWSTNTWLATKIRHAIHRLFKVDIALWETGYRFLHIEKSLVGYDLVQLINSWSIRATIAREKRFVTFLAENNDRLFLSACGTDTHWVESLLRDELPYHLLTRYLNDPSTAGYYESTLKYVSPKHIDLYEHVVNNVEKIIPTDIDYLLSLREMSPEFTSRNKKATPLIPTPINLSLLTFKSNPVVDRIIIFHGINRNNYFNKGNHIFENALEIIQKQYADKVDIITVESLPYSEYMKAYDRAHILLDQVYSHDQGYNALEAMARGKVVFTGAGSYFKEHYNLKETVAIDATPDPNQIASELEKLILNPNSIAEIGINAKTFVETHHDHIKIAKKYVEVWNN